MTQRHVTTHRDTGITLPTYKEDAAARPFTPYHMRAIPKPKPPAPTRMPTVDAVVAAMKGNGWLTAIQIHKRAREIVARPLATETVRQTLSRMHGAGKVERFIQSTARDLPHLWRMTP